jgi:hypothetical protein
VKSELHIFCQTWSQNYIFVKSKLHICLWKTPVRGVRTTYLPVENLHSWSQDYIFESLFLEREVRTTYFVKSELHISWSQNYIFVKSELHIWVDLPQPVENFSICSVMVFRKRNILWFWIGFYYVLTQICSSDFTIYE